MENFIKEIIAIDERAEKLTAKAERDLNGLGEVINAKKIEISKQINEICEKSFFEIREEKETALKRAMVEMDLAGEKALKSMESEFELNQAKWEEEIINSAINANIAGNQGAR